MIALVSDTTVCVLNTLLHSLSINGGITHILTQTSLLILLFIYLFDTFGVCFFLLLNSGRPKFETQTEEKII